MMGNLIEGFTDALYKLAKKKIKENKFALGGGATGTVVGAISAYVINQYFGNPIPPGLAVVAGTMAGVAVGTAGGYHLDTIVTIKNRKLGLVAPEIIVRMKKEGNDKVLEFSNVKILDKVETIKKVIDEQFSPESSSKLKYNFDQEPSYSVKITLKNKEVTIGEIDYGDLLKENTDYKVEVFKEVKKEGETFLEAVTKDNEINEVLGSLNDTPKLLGANEQLIHPGDKVLDKLSESPNFHEGILGSWFGEWANRLQNWITVRNEGKTCYITIDPTKGLNHKIETNEFLDELTELAIKKKKITELLGHYEKTIENSNLQKLAAEVKSHEADWEVLESKSSKAMLLTIAFVVSGALTFAFSYIAVSGVVTIVATGIFSFMPLLATYALVITFPMTLAFGLFATIKIFYSYKASKVKKSLDKIKKELTDKNEELEDKYKGLEETAKELEEFTKTEKDELKLENLTLSDSCLRVISKFIVTPQGKNCKKLILNNNKITAEGANILANALKNAPNITSIDLTGTNLEEKGLKAIESALSESITITEFSSDLINNEIEKHLLINKYIQNKLELTKTETQDNINRLFDNFDSFMKKSREKISNVKRFDNLKVKEPIREDQQLKDAVREKQFELLFAEYTLPTSTLLEKYINIFKNSTPENRKNVPQKTILESIKKSLYIITNKPSPLSFDERTALFAECLSKVSKDKNSYGIAYLTSRLIDIQDVFNNKIQTPKLKKMRELIMKIYSWDTKDSWTFDKYIDELQSLKKDPKLPEEDRDEIENLIQESLKSMVLKIYYKYEAEEDVAKKRKKISDELDDIKPLWQQLRSFEIDIKEKLPDEIKEDLEITVGKNKLVEAIKTQSRDEILEIYEKLPLKQIREFFKRMDEDNKNYIIKLVKDDLSKFDPKTSFLKKMDKQYRTELLASCFGKNTPDDSCIATIVSGLIDIREKLEGVETPLKDKNEYIRRISSEKPWDFNNYISNIKALRDNIYQQQKYQPTEYIYPELYDKVETILQQALTERIRFYSEDTYYKDKIPLENEFNLRKFELDLNTISASEQDKKKIEQIIERNKRFDEIHLNLLQIPKGQELHIFEKFIKQLSQIQSKKEPVQLEKFLDWNKDRNTIKQLFETNPLGSIKELSSLDKEQIKLLYHMIYDKWAKPDNANLFALILKIDLKGKYVQPLYNLFSKLNESESNITAKFKSMLNNMLKENFDSALESLYDLREKNERDLIELLEKYFSGEENADKKAALVSNVLAIKDEYPTIQSELKEHIRKSIVHYPTPFFSLLSPPPKYYDYEDLKIELELMPIDLKDKTIKQKIIQEINKAIDSAQQPKPGEKPLKPGM